MEAEVYPNEKVTQFISSNFLPVKIHVKEQPQMFQRFKAKWTPTQLIMASDGTEHHRIEGFMPVEDYLADLELGLAKLHFDQLQYKEAETKFRSIYQRYPYSGAGPQAAYWAGVSAYKATNQPEPLVNTAKFLKEKYPENEWTRKASVWLN